MFVIIRNVNGITETLKDSSSQDDKMFTDYYKADLLVKQLNENIVPNMHWSVSDKSNLISKTSK